MKWLRLFLVYPLLSLLPAPLAYRLAELAYRYDPALRRPTRLAVANGMRRALPEAADAGRLAKLLDEYQAMLGRELLDVYYLPRLNAQTIDRWVSIDGLDHLLGPSDDGRGRILVMAHFSRPSLLVTALSIKGVTLHILTQAIDRNNPELDRVERLFLRFKVWANRRHVRGEWVTVNDNPRLLYERLKAGETVVMLFDVRPSGKENAVQAPFLGHTLTVPQGFQRLAQRTGAALYYGAIHDEGWRAKIAITPLQPDATGSVVGAAAKRLEEEVRKHPAQWWQWNIFDYLIQASERR